MPGGRGCPGSNTLKPYVHKKYLETHHKDDLSTSDNHSFFPQRLIVVGTNTHLHTPFRHAGAAEQLPFAASSSNAWSVFPTLARDTTRAFQDFYEPYQHDRTCLTDLTVAFIWSFPTTGSLAMDCLPPILCFQCGTDQNPCHCKVIGPTLGFFVTIGAAVGSYDTELELGMLMFITDLLLASVSAMLLLCH